MCNKNQRIERKVLGEVLEKSDINSIQVRPAENKDVEITIKAKVGIDGVMSIISRENEYDDRSTPEHQNEGRPNRLQLTYEE